MKPSPDLYQGVLSLRVVRRFQPDPLTEEHWNAILEAARWTGSAKNRQDWVFIGIKERETLDRLCDCGDFTTPLSFAPNALVPVGIPPVYDWDLGRASQNIMLAASALGVGSCPVTLHRDNLAHEVLGVPEDHLCRYAIALGYPDMEAEREGRKKIPLSGRKPLSELVRWESF